MRRIPTRFGRRNAPPGARSTDCERQRAGAARSEAAAGDEDLACRREPARRRDVAVPPPASRQPGRLVGVGSRGVAGRGRRRQADPPLGGLLRVPLVPRDGARVVRGRRSGHSDERRVRLHQGRPRRASRHRRDLHGGCPSDLRPRRLADDGLHDCQTVSRSSAAPTTRRNSSSTCSRRSPTHGGRGAPSCSSRRGRSRSRSTAWRP